MTRARILSKLGSSPAVFSDGAVVAGITTIDASGVNITGVATATSFSGDGSSLSGISTAAVPGINTERHSVFNTINVSGIATVAGHSVFNTINASGIVTASNISIPDNGKFTCGAGDDLELGHNGSNSYIKDVGTGDLIIQANNLQMSNTSGTNYLHANTSAEVSLYHNGNVKFATNANGVTVTGNVAAGIATFTGVINADAGIDFSGINNATAGMTSELLDSYEEGTFTVGFSWDGGDAVITANTSYDDMYYTKIGRICHVYGQIRVDTVSGSGGGYNNLKVTGLPFTVKSGAMACGGVHVSYLDISEATADSLSAQPWQFDVGTTNIELDRHRYDGFEFGAGDTLLISATYMVN